MPGNARSRLRGILAELRRVPDVVAVAIARRDGLLITHSLPNSVNPKKIAAMAASIVGTSELATMEVGQGSFEQVLVDSTNGKMLATGAGEEAILITMVTSEANIGLVLLSIDKAVRSIAELLDMEKSAESEVIA